MTYQETPAVPANEGPGQRMMTVREVARLLNVQASAVIQWDQRGLMRSYRVGPQGDARFREKDVVEFLLKGSSGAAGSTPEAG